MRSWSRDGDLWRRRSSIICQIKAKGETDVGCLADCLQANLADREFFIRKAIGWALREYAKADADWVRDFVREHESELSPLSRREALKHLR
jgi:3-methyladenine DNA glycosylase AlkD